MGFVFESQEFEGWFSNFQVQHTCILNIKDLKKYSILSRRDKLVKRRCWVNGIEPNPIVWSDWKKYKQNP